MSGGSFRTLVAAASLGLCEYVTYLVDGGRCSKYYLGGVLQHFKGDDVLRLIGISALSSFPCDVALTLTMEDDRLHMRLPSIDDALENGLLKVENIDLCILESIGESLGLSARELSALFIFSSWTSVIYVKWKLRSLTEMSSRRCPSKYC